MMFGGGTRKKGFPPKRKKQKIVVQELESAANSRSADNEASGDGSEIRRRNLEETTAKYLATGAKKQLEAIQVYKEALAEDASIFDYDGVYETVSTQTREEQRKVAKSNEEKKSKYIDKLMRTAKQREFVTEKALNRKAARDGAEEDALYGKASEVFVTAAYKRRLEERNNWEKEEERRAAEEAKNDVRKRGGLTEFYSGVLDSLDDPSRRATLPVDFKPTGETNHSMSNTSSSATQVMASGSINSSYSDRAEPSEPSSRGRMNPESVSPTHSSEQLRETEADRTRRRREELMKQVEEAQRKRALEEDRKRKVAPAPKTSADRIAAARAAALERRRKIEKERKIELERLAKSG